MRNDEPEENPIGHGGGEARLGNAAGNERRRIGRTEVDVVGARSGRRVPRQRERRGVHVRGPFGGSDDVE